ncbi:protein ABERRANT POLLEN TRANSMISSION 1-like isoform X2 [Malus domestica]|uniref:protein ABERRANT POLLEN TRANSMISSION 1-like isoform X2 n=1 Tax=Malus domestica TaxID=3750 RepID=UPI0039769D4A
MRPLEYGLKLRSTQRYSRCLFGICCAVYCLCQDLYGHFGSGKGDESTSFGFYLDIQEPPNCIMFSSPNSGQESCTCLMYYATSFQPQVYKEVYIGRWRKVNMLRSASGTTPPMKTCKTYTDLS